MARMWSACPSAAFPVTDAAAEAASIAGTHSTPYTFGLVGGERILETLFLNRTNRANLLRRHCGGLVFPRRKEHVGVCPGAGGIITP